MNYKKLFGNLFLCVFLLLPALGFGTSHFNWASAQDNATLPSNLWEDATATTIGTTAEWTNKIELADINGDGLVDMLFANGGNYDRPGTPVSSRVFVNNGPGKMFSEVTDEVFGDAKMLARVIKVRDINADSSPDIIVGTTFETQSRLYIGDGKGGFTDVTTTQLPEMDASVGDLELGDIDGDADLDMVLANWGPGSPMSSRGGRTLLWLNDGTGHFTDVTSNQMPDVLVQFSWELDFVDVDNDYDLDIAISCKICSSSFLFENDGKGYFTDVSKDRLPHFRNNYEFEAMDINGDEYLDLVTINDGAAFTEHVFVNNQQGGFDNLTDELWHSSQNRSYDDNVIAFLDFDSDGDADFLIGSLDGPDRLIINDGAGNLTLASRVFNVGSARPSRGTLYMGLADLNSDGRLDVVEGQGEAPGSEDERVYLGTGIQPDTAPPKISLVETISEMPGDQSIHIHARVHDNKSPTMPHDWQAVVLRWTVNGETHDSPMSWYGEYLWQGVIDKPASGTLEYQVCATDAEANEACSVPQMATVG